jgi:hypothetical protein
VMWDCSAANNNATIKHFYWDNCDFYIEGASIGSGIEPAIIGIYTNGSDRALGQQGIGFVGCDFTVDTGQIGNGLQPVVSAYWAMVGCTFTPVGNAQVAQAVLEHWIYPHVQSHAMYRWCDFNAIDGGFCINGNWDTSGVQDPNMDGFYIGECEFDGSTGNSNSCILDIGQGADGTFGANTGPDTQYRHVVIERNSFHGWTNTNPIQEADGEVVRSLTMRGSRSWDNLNLYTAPSFNGVYKLYGNYIYVEADGANGTFGFHDDARFAPSMFTDNTIVNDNFWDFGLSPTVHFMSWRSATHVTLGSFCDRNTYFSNYTGPGPDFFGATGGAMDMTWGEWQTAGWDANGRFQSNPGWTRPVTQWSHFDTDQDDITVLRVTTGTAASFRADYTAEMFKGPQYSGALPTNGTEASPTLDIVSPLPSNPANLDQVDLHEIVVVDDDDVTIGTAKCYVFRPTAGTSNNKLVVDVLGHTHQSGASFSAINYGTIVKELVAEGYTVAATYMSPFEGTSANAVIFHNTMPQPTSTFNALRIFTEIPIRILNELEGEGWDKMFLIGLSGGGWMGAVCGAVEQRFDAIVSLAGFFPLYMSGTRDWEQNLYGLADSVNGCDYTDLAALAAQNRPFKQLIIQGDPSFPKVIYDGGPPYETILNTFATAGGGSFDLEFLLGESTHEWSTAARAATISFLNAN